MINYAQYSHLFSKLCLNYICTNNHIRSYIASSCICMLLMLTSNMQMEDLQQCLLPKIQEIFVVFSQLVGHLRFTSKTLI